VRSPRCPSVDLYRQFEDAGVTDLVCAPWMLAEMSENRDYRSALDAKLAATEECRDERDREDGLKAVTRSLGPAVGPVQLGPSVPGAPVPSLEPAHGTREPGLLAFG